MSLSRRTLLTSLTATAALAWTGCSTGPTGGAPSGTAESPAPEVRIRHAFGETIIDHAPKRVATLGWTDHDHALALGVPPIGATALTWGGNAATSSDWFDAALARVGGTPPVRYADTDGTPVDEVAKLAPDLILATNSGITAEDYAKLTKIAPVVAYPTAPWTTPWEESLTLIGRALGRSPQAEAVAADTHRVIAEAQAAYPQLQGKTAVFAHLSAADLSTIGIYGAADNRVRTLVSLGLRNAPIVQASVEPGKFYGTVSAERASTVESDIILTYAENPTDLNTFARHPLIGQIPALKAGHAYAEVDKRIGLAITNPSPLSMPVIVERFLPSVGRIAPRG